MNPNEDDGSIFLKYVAEDYAKYLEVDTSQQKRQLDFELEAALAQLEEYESLVIEDMQKTFESIDNLENLVTEVKTDLNTLEAAVGKAERDLKVGLNISSVFKPFLFMKEPSVLTTSNSEDLAFSLSSLKFNVDKYFPPQNNDDDDRNIDNRLT